LSKKDNDYLEALRSDAEESVNFFGNEMKTKRERGTCAAFLRCLGIKFSSASIKTGEDPPDIIFDSARFEICEILEKDRRRHQEYKEYKKKLETLNNPRELELKHYTPKPILFDEVLLLVSSELSKKFSKYGYSICSKLDALVYINLRTSFLEHDSPLKNLDVLRKQGWRSVSIIFSPYSYVFFATDKAPKFLKNFIGQTKSEWRGYPDGLFEID
jgi:hypothetical protein